MYPRHSGEFSPIGMIIAAAVGLWFIFSAIAAIMPKSASKAVFKDQTIAFTVTRADERPPKVVPRTPPAQSTAYCEMTIRYDGEAGSASFLKRGPCELENGKHYEATGTYVCDHNFCRLIGIKQ